MKKERPEPAMSEAKARGLACILRELRPFRSQPESMARFELAEREGSECMATVYRALDRKSGDEVAIKIAAGTDNARTALRKEEKALRCIIHPNVIALLDSGVFRDGPFEGAPFLVLGHLAGESLHERIMRLGSLPWGESRAILDGVLSALEAAHGAGFVHRDVKPENVMLDGNAPTLIDFGVSERMGWRSFFTLSFVPGNGMFAAPEMFGAGVDGRTDLYAAGMLASYMLTGMPPNPGDKVQRIRLPSRIGTIIAKATENEPGKRYQSAVEMRAALAAVQSLES
ncbi:MAG: serine/threonine-protein kinase [Candidatus Micrarchaeota archaeon]